MQKRKHHDAHDDEDDPGPGAPKPDRRNLGGPSADMNVTPLIDVLLVLLVIFLAALPMTQNGMDINLPLETKTEVKSDPSQQLVIELSSDLRLTLNRQPIELGMLAATLQAQIAGRTDRTVFIMGSGQARYGDVIAIIDQAQSVGLRVGIVTEAMRAAAARR